MGSKDPRDPLYQASSSPFYEFTNLRPFGGGGGFVLGQPHAKLTPTGVKLSEGPFRWSAPAARAPSTS